MRRVVEEAGERSVDTTDGVRVVESDGRWVMVLPDPAEAVTHLWAEGPDDASANALLDEWSEVVESAGKVTARAERHAAEGPVRVWWPRRATMCGMPQQQPDRSSPAPGAAPRRLDASMSLLTNVMEHSLDDGYAEAAARRGEVGTSRLPKTLNGKLGLAAGLVLAAVVVTLGAAQAQHSAPTEAKERQKLIDRVQTETKSADALQKSVDALRRHGRRRAAGRAPAARRRPQPDAGSARRGHTGARAGREAGRQRRQGSLRRRAPAARGRATASPTPGGSATTTCSAWSTACGRRGPRRSASTDSVSPHCRRSGPPGTPYWSTTSRWCRRTRCWPSGTGSG